MSTHRKQIRGPDVPSVLIKGAFTGAVGTVILIPVFRRVLVELAVVHRSLSRSGGPFLQEPIVFGAIAIVAVWAIKSSQQRDRGVPARRGRY